MNQKTFRAIGASNHFEEEREIHDYYATEPKATIELLKIETFSPEIWEPACGEGHISQVLIQGGYNVRSTDLIERGYGQGGIDFLSIEIQEWSGDIVTNPPFVYASEFVMKALTIMQPGRKLALFLKTQFLEASNRKQLFINFPPVRVWVSSSRLVCAKNGNFVKYRKGSCFSYAWFIWEKGHKGDTVLKWFN